jgi:hypothetical protein
VPVEGADRNHIEQHEQQVDLRELVEEELRAEFIQGRDPELPSPQVQIDGDHGEKQVHGRAGGRHYEISRHGFELGRVGRYGLRVAEANQHHHQQAHGVDVAYRVQRQSSRLLRGIVAVELGRERVAELVEAERDHQGNDNDRKQREVSVGQ